MESVDKYRVSELISSQACVLKWFRSCYEDFWDFVDVLLGYLSAAIFERWIVERNLLHIANQGNIVVGDDNNGFRVIVVSPAPESGFWKLECRIRRTVEKVCSCYCGSPIGPSETNGSHQEPSFDHPVVVGRKTFQPYHLPFIFIFLKAKWNTNQYTLSVNSV